MQTFAIIDNYSGWVWGLETATNPLDACRLADEKVGTYGREYETGFSGDQGYLVYEAPAGFEVSDGQDRVQIEAVRALPMVARVGWRDQN